MVSERALPKDSSGDAPLIGVKQAAMLIFDDDPQHARVVVDVADHIEKQGEQLRAMMDALQVGHTMAAHATTDPDRGTKLTLYGNMCASTRKTCQAFINEYIHMVMPHPTVKDRMLEAAVVEEHTRAKATVDLALAVWREMRDYCETAREWCATHKEEEKHDKP